MNRDERGVGTVSGLLWLGVLISIGMACVLVVGVITTHRRSQAAADLAALAGAQAQQRGGSGCSAAAVVAFRNLAHVETCRVEGRDVLVTVGVRMPRLVGARFVVKARARAGPSGLGGLEPGDLLAGR